MADLPAFRLTTAYPYCDTGVDLAGPLIVRSGRKPIKVWLVLFTCLRIRSIHVDIVKKLQTDALLDTLIRFHALHDGVKRFLSDNGTNLRGADNLLRAMMDEWKAVADPWLTTKRVSWDFIPPHTPWAGGTWERLIRSFKKVLKALVNEDMDIERFRTLVIVATGIINRRPLTRVSSDPRDPRPLTPMTFLSPGAVLTASSDIIPTTPLSGSRLRRSQDSLRPLLESLWKRWRTEYVADLQRRHKWLARRRNLQVGDLLLMVDELAPREFWPLAIIVKTFPDDLGNVRRLLLRNSAGKEVERDVRKVVLLEREGEGETVVEETRRTVGEKTNSPPRRNLRPRK